MAYRRRRLRDAARLLPLAATILLLMPLLWSGAAQRPISQALLYLFVIWALVIVVAAGFAGALLIGKGDGAEEDED